MRNATFLMFIFLSSCSDSTRFKGLGFPKTKIVEEIGTCDSVGFCGVKFKDGTFGKAGHPSAGMEMYSVTILGREQFVDKPTWEYLKGLRNYYERL